MSQVTAEEVRSESLGEVLFDFRHFPQALENVEMIARQASLQKQGSYLLSVLSLLQAESHEERLADQLAAHARASGDRKAQTESELRQGLELAYALVRRNAGPIQRTKTRWQQAVSQLCEREGSLREGSFLAAKVRRGGNRKNKLALSEHLSRNLNDYLYVRKKTEGDNSAGRLGGEYITCYRGDDDRVAVQRVLVKQDVSYNRIHHSKNISEFVSSRIMNLMNPDIAASVFFIHDPEGEPDSDDSVYVASVFYEDDYKDLYKKLYEKQNICLREHGLPELPIPTQRPRFMHSLFNSEYNQIFREHMVRRSDDGDFPEDEHERECAFEDFEKSAIASLFVGDFDVHAGNYGIISLDHGGEKKECLRRVDMGASLENIVLKDGRIHMDSYIHHPFGFGPTNHFREFSRDYKITRKFAQQLRFQGTFDRDRLSSEVDSALNEVARHYGSRALKDFAVRLGLSSECLARLAKVESHLRLAGEIARELSAILFQRQDALLRLAAEIELSVAVKDDIERNADAIKAVILKYPTYFSDSSHLRLRRKDQQVKFFHQLYSSLGAGIEFFSKQVLEHYFRENYSIDIEAHEISISARALDEKYQARRQGALEELRCPGAAVSGRTTRREHARLNFIRLRLAPEARSKEVTVSVHSLHRMEYGKHVSEIYFKKSEMMHLGEVEYFHWARIEVEKFRELIPEESSVVIRGELPEELVKALVIYCNVKNYLCILHPSVPPSVRQYKPESVACEAMRDFLDLPPARAAALA